MGGSKSKTSTEVNYEPETAAALEKEIQMFLGNLLPIQREQLLKYTSILPNQPGRVGASALAPPSTFAPLTAAQQEGQERLNLPTAPIAGIGEALLAGQHMMYPAAYAQAKGVGGGMTTFIDPRFGEQMKPVVSSSTEQEADPAQMGMQAAALVATVALAIL